MDHMRSISQAPGHYALVVGGAQSAAFQFSDFLFDKLLLSTDNLEENITRGYACPNDNAPSQKYFIF